MKEELRIFDTTEKTDDGATQQELLESVREDSLDARLISDDNTLDMVAKKVVQDLRMEKQASTIVSWYREFLRLDGPFRLDCRGVHEREWILCEEDKQLELLEWLKKEKRATTKKPHEYLNSKLFADERYFILIEKYGLTLPISYATVHSWMIKIGCKFDRVEKSYYTDANERSDIKEYLRVYIDRRRFYQLRQPCWVQRKWCLLSSEEQEKLSTLSEVDEDALSAEVHRFSQNNDEWVEFLFDFLGARRIRSTTSFAMSLATRVGSTAFNPRKYVVWSATFPTTPRSASATNSFIPWARTRVSTKLMLERAMNG